MTIIFKNCKKMESKFNLTPSEVIAILKDMAIKENNENAFVMIGKSGKIITYLYLNEVLNLSAKDLLEFKMFLLGI